MISYASWMSERNLSESPFVMITLTLFCQNGHNTRRTNFKTSNKNQSEKKYWWDGEWKDTTLDFATDLKLRPYFHWFSEIYITYSYHWLKLLFSESLFFILKTKLRGAVHWINYRYLLKSSTASYHWKLHIDEIMNFVILISDWVINKLLIETINSEF